MADRAANSVIAELQERIAHLDSGAGRVREVLPFGVAEIDRRLPGGGLGLGCLHEVAGCRLPLKRKNAPVRFETST